MERNSISEIKTNNPAKKGNVPWNKGIPQTEETKKKISESGKRSWIRADKRREEKSIFTKKLWEEGVFDNRPMPSPETIEKIRQFNIGRKQTEYQKQRVRETKSKTWKVTSPDGETQIIKSLNNFCKDKKVDSGNLSKYGHSKGWKAERIDNA